MQQPPDQQPPDHDELLYEAWTIIANAYNGNWADAPPEWKNAAERWRDRWHETRATAT